MNKRKLIKEMIRELNFRHQDYDDGCGEINYTLLAETMAEEHDLYEDHEDFNIPEEVFDAAIDAVAQWKELNEGDDGDYPSITGKMVA